MVTVHYKNGNKTVLNPAYKLCQ